MKARLTLILLFALFLAPILVAVLLNSRWIDWEPAPDRSHGILIEPVVPLPAFEIATADGETVNREALLGRWILVQIEPGTCDEACRQRAYLLRQVRAGQNRHVPDIDLLMITGSPPDAGLSEQIRSLDPVFDVIGGPAVEPILASFPESEGGGFYIVDPDGNIMERFGSDTDPTGIRKDLRRLLTWTVRE
jgi:cytochrome oxidase Cu insertion factor (SCO1/SenC/PrrC family)